MIKKPLLLVAILLVFLTATASAAPKNTVYPLFLRSDSSGDYIMLESGRIVFYPADMTPEECVAISRSVGLDAVIINVE